MAMYFNEYWYDAYAMIDIIKDSISAKLKGNKDEYYLAYAAGVIALSPSKKNLNWLRKLFESEEDYELYQQKYKDFLFYHGELAEQSRTKSNGKWRIIDFWGTWCSPCIREIGIFQILDSLSKNQDSSVFHVETYSFKSPNIELFMKKNNYTFDVKELENSQTASWEIYLYPSLYLISPGGKVMNLSSSQHKFEIVMHLIGIVRISQMNRFLD